MRYKGWLIIFLTGIAIKTYGQTLADTTKSQVDGEAITEVTAEDLDFEEDKSTQNIAGLLRSSGDVFTRATSYQFRIGRFRPRGYDSKYLSVSMNNIPMLNPETDIPTWYEWGGLNDVMRNREHIPGLGAGGFSFGNIGGSSNIETRPSMQRAQSKLTYSNTNGAYRQRVAATYSTGMMDDKWGFTFSSSRRWANEGYIDGTFYDAYAWFAAAERKLNEKHSLVFTTFGSPSSSGMRGASTQEAYDLLDNQYYNPYWGYQDGKKRNSRVRSGFEPNFMINHYWKISSITSLTGAIGYSFGTSGYTSLDWYDAPDPRPDYYRYMPSFFEDQTAKDAATELWKNDEERSQINFDQLYYINKLMADEGKQAKYIIGNRKDDHSQIVGNIIAHHALSDQLKLQGGADLQIYSSNHYKEIDDLLGGAYWVDIDQYAERDFIGDTLKLQNDLNNPDQKIYDGGKYGYNYNININSGGGWLQSTYTREKYDVYGAINARNTSFYRTGKMKNGRYPDNSLGKSEVSNFFTYGVKGGGTYKITGRHYVTANAIYLTLPPAARDAFVSANIKNELIKNLTTEKVISEDVTYTVSLPKITTALTVYNTNILDRTDQISFYHDEYRTFVHLIMNNIDEVHRGLEWAAEIKASPSVELSSAVSLGQYLYTSRPNAVISTENGSRNDTTEIIYQRNFFVPGSPQSAATAGISYRHPKFWFLNADVNYLGNNYLSFNPERRTLNAVFMVGEDDPRRLQITKQKQLNDAFTLDLSLGKSLMFNLPDARRLFININFSVNNVLGVDTYKTGGFEQMRFDFTEKNIDKFPPKYYYGFGRTYYLNINFRI